MTTTKTGKNLENKQMGGCMAGLFNFSHLLSGKRSNLKRLPPPPLPSSASGDDSASEPISSVGCPALSKHAVVTQLQQSPEPEIRSPASDPVSVSAPKSPLSTLEFKEAFKSPWKFSRETPRLSLDSRAVVDAKGGLRPREIRINSCAGNEVMNDNQHRSPCVIARLMGLDQPPSSSSDAEKTVDLRRSTSESRSRDYRFLDSPSFLSRVACKNEVAVERKWDQSRSSAMNNNVAKSNPRMMNQKQNQKQNHNQRRLMTERRSHYNTADFFPPEIPAKQQYQQQEAVTIYGEIERRLRMRGIDEPSKDLETLKHILEALQLKGLLHSSIATATATSTTTTNSRRNLVFERQPPMTPMNRRRVNTSASETSVSPRRERPARSPGRSSSPPVRRKGGALPLNVETQRRSGQSPKTTKRSDHNQAVNRSPRGNRSTAEITHGQTQRFSRRGPVSPDDEAEASTVSECSFGTENERWRSGEEYREGKSLLERCDKLLHSIAEMNSNSNTNSAELQQPSPVSVLDSSFYKDEEESPSPVKKRTIHFKDQAVPELEDELWSPSSLSSSPSSSSPSSRTQLLSNPDYHHHHHAIHSSPSSDDPDFIYISEVFRAYNYLPGEPDLFLLLEKQISITSQGSSNASFFQRKLIFDTVLEILDWPHRLPLWKSGPGRPSLNWVWAEYQRVRNPGLAQDLFELITGLLKKDLALAQDSVNGWGDYPVEISKAVLDIERLIFKDLIGEAIQDLAVKNMGGHKHCRKLVF